MKSVRTSGSPLRSGQMAFAALVVTWGSTYAFIAVALEAYSPLEITALRLILASVVLNLQLYWSRKRFPFDFALLRRLLPLAALGNVAPFYLIALGGRHIGSGLVSVLVATTPVWTVFLHWRAPAEVGRRASRLVMSLVGLIGVALVFGAQGWELSPSALRGGAPVVGAAMCFAGALKLASRIQQESRLSSLNLATAQLSVSASLMMPLLIMFWLRTGPPALGPMRPVIALVLLATVSTGFGYFLYYYSIARIGAPSTSMINVAMPLVSVAIGSVWLGESFGTREMFGVVLIVSCLFALQRGAAQSAPKRGQSRRAAGHTFKEMS